jgi:RHS repeat-associated protein
MFSRTLNPGRRLRRALVAVLTVAALVAGSLALVRAVTTGRQAPASQAGAAVPVHAVHSQRHRVPTMPAWHRRATSWPAAGTATVSLTATDRSPGRPHGRASAQPSAGSVRAGDLPVWVGPPDTGGAAVAKGSARTPASTTAVVARRGSRAGTDSVTEVSRAQVSVTSQRAAHTLGVRGLVLSLAGAGDAAGAGRVHVSVSYRRFAQAYGGDYGSRLRLVEMPACALSTPAVARCRTQTPVGSLNNARKHWVGADVKLPAPVSAAASVRGAAPGIVLTSAVRAPRVVLAVVAAPSGSAGSFAAEPLSESTTGWVGGASSGAYTWSYPVKVPPVPGGLAPTVALNYDSQATSGLTSSTNNQASWVGDGFDYSPGFIEADYTTCSTDAGEPDTGDLCPNGEQVTLSLNGVTTPLVNGSGKWVAEADGGQSVKQSGNTWEIIEPNGTQYWFGLNQLPGYTSGDPVTNSVWTTPVWEGCGQAALCNLPWRYNLDYVVDPHGNAIAYFYNPQTNYYAEQDGTTGTGAYTQGGVLTKIEYGLRAGQVYTSTPAGQVTFTSAAGRQDAPTDLSCTSGAPCAVTSPTFWDDDALTTITTQALEGSALTNVDSYSLATTYPPTGDQTTSPSLWLQSVTQTGQDGSTPVTLPPVSFAGTARPNRVETAADQAAGYSDLTRFYLSSITNDTGGQTSISYSPADPAPCAAGSLPAPDANTAACYPDYWTPSGGTSQAQGWFNLYTVSSVTKTDTTGGDPPVVTSYAYAGPAWHWDAGTISRSATVTWDQYRGYQTVTTKTGTAPDPVTESTATFLQGMSQDGPPSGTGPVVTVTTSRGQQVTDSSQFAGMTLERIGYDGAGTGQQVTDTVNLPWSSSAIVVNTGLDQAAYLTGTSSALTYTALGGGGTRDSAVDYTYNSAGQVTARSTVPDAGNAAEDTCTDTTYAANTSTGLVDLPATVTVDTGACNASGQGTGALVSETESCYDGQGLGIGATAGNLTKSEQATAVGFFDTTTYSYDAYGRNLTTTSPDGDTTTTAYTPATGAEPTSVSVTDPMGLATVTSYDPARALPLTVTVPDGDVTTTAYDALGRQTATWTPGNPASGPATTTWSYATSDTAPPVTTEQDLEPAGNRLITDTIDDSFGAVRQVQKETAGGGTDITDTSYDSDGWKALNSGPYYVSGAPSGTLVEAAASSVPDQTGYAYDGDGRVARQISYHDGNETFETDTAYGGDYTTVTPPAGGTPQTTWTDGRGLTTAIWQYHAGVPVSSSDPASEYDATAYTYNAAGKLATITDAAKNPWSYAYNLLGDQTSQTTPDTGTTTTSYDPAQLVLSVTDARGKTTSWSYDADGRKTAKYDTTGGAAKSASDEIASWSYDTVAKGQLASSTAYSGGTQYTEKVTGYAANGQPSGIETIVPSSQGALAGTYTQTYTYAASGQQTSYTDSAAGGLPAETVTVGYDNAGNPAALNGASPYVGSLSHTDLGQPLQYAMGTSAEPVYLTDSYDPQTGNLTEQNVQTGAAETSVDILNYSYDDVGDVTAEADTPAGAPAAAGVQCFQYDYLGRLVQAWAQGTAGCAPSPSASAEGGAAPYWESFSYGSTGTLTTQTGTTPAGVATTTTNTYPSAGSAQPHAVTAQAVTTTSGTSTTDFTYNADGQLTSATGGSQNESLTWNDAGQLSQDAVTPAGGGTAQDTSYAYDADGTLLLTADPGSTTLYLSDEELTLSGGTVTGTRYYTLGNMTVATRTGASSVSYLAGDHEGTDAVAISASSLAVTRRYYAPYGNSVGPSSSGFPTGEKGFAGGADDTATSLTDLGAREYQPGTGSFISTDSIQNSYDPQDLNPYAYATDNPATKSDPTGATPAVCNASGCTSTNLDDVATIVNDSNLASSITCQQAQKKNGATAAIVSVACAIPDAAAPPPPPCPGTETCIGPASEIILYVQRDPNAKSNCSPGAPETYLGTVQIAPYVYNIGNQLGSYYNPLSTSPGNSSLNYYSYDEYAFNTARVYRECNGSDWVDVYYGGNPIVRTVTGSYFCAGDSEGDSDCYADPILTCTKWSNYNWIPEWVNPALQKPAKPSFWGSCSGPTVVSRGAPVVLSGG